MSRHGDWPLVVPPDQPDEAHWLYEQIAAPLDYGRCTCGDDAAECVCGDLEEDRDEEVPGSRAA